MSLISAGLTDAALKALALSYDACLAVIKSSCFAVKAGTAVSKYSVTILTISSSVTALTNFKASPFVPLPCISQPFSRA